MYIYIYVYISTHCNTMQHTATDLYIEQQSCGAKENGSEDNIGGRPAEDA